jgi:DNA-binding CsgD family transcriptional regulator
VTDRLRRILLLLADGYSTQQIATQLFVSPRTVKYDLEQYVAANNLRNRTHAVAHAIRNHLI